MWERSYREVCLSDHLLALPPLISVCSVGTPLMRGDRLPEGVPRSKRASIVTVVTTLNNNDDL